MKRTPESGDKNRDCVFRFRVTKDEKKNIQQLAKQRGMSVSKYMRTRSTESENSGLPARDLLIRYQAELGKQGSNLNQIAKAVNRRELTGEPIGFSAALVHSTFQKIEELTNNILKILRDGNFRKSKG